MSEGYGTSPAGPPPTPAVTPEQAIRKAIENYTNFEGRATRPEFWWVALAIYVVGLVLYLIDLALFGLPVLSGLFWLATIVPYLAVGARRLHDTNRSGWWLLIGLIPCVGAIVLIIFLAQPGNPG